VRSSDCRIASTTACSSSSVRTSSVSDVGIIRYILKIKLHFRSIFCTFFGLKIWFLVKSEKLGSNITRETSYLSVVALYLFIKSRMCRYNLVFCASQFVLQV